MKKNFFGSIFIDQTILKNCYIFHPIQLEYYILEDDDNYGLQVIKTEYFENKSSIEENSLFNVTDNKNQIEYILNLLKNNSVTPIAINDILSDILCQNH